MHKGMILLVKAEDREDAESQVEAFLEPYGDGDVWDWYSIGGRWTGLLDGYDPEEDPDNVETCILCGGTGFRDDPLGNDARANQPTYTCNGCGAYDHTTNTWTHGKHGPGKKVKWPTSWEHYDGDILPLEQCLPKVQEWCNDLDASAAEFLAKMNAAIEEEKANPDQYKMSGYYARLYGDAVQGNFSFETNVFDVWAGEAEKIPEDITGYWAVVCDLHN